MKRYRAKVGLSWETKSGTKHVEAGQIATGIPEHSVPWLLEQGLIEPVGKGED